MKMETKTYKELERIFYLHMQTLAKMFRDFINMGLSREEAYAKLEDSRNYIKNLPITRIYWQEKWGIK